MTNLKYLLSRFQKIVAAFTVLSLVTVLSCKEDDEKPISIATVQFATIEQEVSESGTAVTVTIEFDKGAGKAGTIAIDLGGTATYTTNYTTNPNGSTGFFALAVAKGQTVAQFTVTPINNALLGGTKTVELTISDVSDGFEIGEDDLNTIYITDDEGPTQANFAVASSETSEEVTEGIDVTINLSSAAPGTGNVTISFTSSTAAYTTNFTTEPAATAGQLVVPVAQSATSVTFKVKPVDDANVNVAREIEFTIASADGVVEVGDAITEHTITITDNETPSTATFTDAEGSILESESAGKTVSITLDPQTNGTGTVAVTITGGVYDTDYTTDPAAVGGVVTVNVASGEPAASFKVIPTNNSTDDGDKELTLTMTGSTGVVVLGVNNITYTLTLEEDDAITTIADVRAMYSGSDVVITDPIKIHGIITSNNDNVTERNAYIQDATGAILLRFNAVNTLNYSDEVDVTLTGATLTEFNGLLQAGGNLPNANGVKTDDGVLPNFEDITLAQLNSGNYESRMVRLSDVGFFDANDVNDLNYNAGYGIGNNKIGDVNGNVSYVRIETYCPYKTDLIPLGTGQLRGIASQTTLGNIIVPQNGAHVFDRTESAIIATTAPGTLDFGDVANGATNDLSFDVSGTLLISDVVVTAPNHYTVSLDDATYSSSVTITSTAANAAPVTVYARFAPTTGNDQTLTGSIVLKSLSAAVQSISVTGDETGNGVVALDTLALWTFEISIPLANDVTTISGLLAEDGGQSGVAAASGVHALAATDYSNPAGNGSAESFSSNTWSTDDYYQFSLNSTGFSDISVSWDQTRSSTGPSAFALYYSTDGTNFTKHADYTVIQGTWAAIAPILTTSHTYDLSSVTALNNSAILVFRLVHTGTGIAAGGTNRIDNVMVEGR